SRWAALSRESRSWTGSPNESSLRSTRWWSPRTRCGERTSAVPPSLAAQLRAVADRLDHREQLRRRHRVVVEVDLRFAVRQVDHRGIDAGDALQRFLHLRLAVAAMHAPHPQFDAGHGTLPIRA